MNRWKIEYLTQLFRQLEIETCEACGGFRLHWLAQPVPSGIWLGGRPCAPLSYAQKDLDPWELPSQCCHRCIHHLRCLLSSSYLVMFGTTKINEATAKLGSIRLLGYIVICSYIKLFNAIL